MLVRVVAVGPAGRLPVVVVPGGALGAQPVDLLVNLSGGPVASAAGGVGVEGERAQEDHEQPDHDDDVEVSHGRGGPPPTA